MSATNFVTNVPVFEGAQGSNKKLMEWMKEVGLLKEPATKMSFGENLQPQNEE